MGAKSRVTCVCNAAMYELTSSLVQAVDALITSTVGLMTLSLQLLVARDSSGVRWWHIGRVGAEISEADRRERR